MHVLFIYPIPSPKHTFVDYHHGLALLSALAKLQGHSTTLFLTHTLSKAEIDRALVETKPDLIAYSVTSDQKELAKAYMNYLAPRKIFSIVGGIHPSIAPEDFLDHIECACRGEGEEAWSELLQGKPLQEIENLAYRRNGSIETNPMRPFLQDLDALPFSDRELFDYQKSLDVDHRADFIAGRGCPYRCSYCVNNWLHGLAPGRYVRLRSPDNLVQEVHAVLNRYNGIESVCFQDDTFTFNKHWVTEFCELYRRQIGLPFVCNIRAETAGQEIIEMLREAGCEEIRIGVEQGNERLRRDILKRKMSNNELIAAFNRIKKAGIKVFAYNMIGVPGETRETIRETVELNRQLRPDKIHISLFHPYPGTELYDQCLKAGYNVDAVNGSFYEPVAVIDTEELTKSEIEFHYRIFRIAVLFPVLLPVAKMLARIKVKKHSTLYDVAYDSMFRAAQFAQRNLPKGIRNALFRALKA
ncbi:radical SAM protein [candidate division KSB1 bacterium]|nr:radical SAM protein [candidate division KSB1 bacterium]